MPSKLQRLNWRAGVAGLICGLAAWLLSFPPLVQGIDDWLFDGCFCARRERPSANRVVIVGLDNATYRNLHKSSVSISPMLARAVRILHDEGAAAIGLDIIIPESIKDLPELNGGEGDAATLGQAIEDVGNVTLSHCLVGEGDRPIDPLPQWQQKRLKAQFDSKPDPLDIGFVDTSPDGDQFCRRQRLFVGDEQNQHLALALVARVNRSRVTWTAAGPSIDGELIPLDSKHRVRINFVGAPGSIPVISLNELLHEADEGRHPDRNLAGAIVLIGDVTAMQNDFLSTPYSNGFFRNPNTPNVGLMHGTELLANVVATLDDRAWITIPWWLSPLPLLLILGPLLGMFYARLSLVSGAVAAIVFHFGWKAFAAGVFSWGGYRAPIVPVLLVGFLAFAATFAVRWRRLRNMLGVVKSTAIARALENAGSATDLHGEERVVTVLFADIRSFTTYGESHSAREVVALLNAYFTAIVPIIERHQGVLNQYAGDGIMVIYGAPDDVPDHALQAVQTAIEIVRQVHAMQTTWTDHDFPNFRIGVGIQTGRVVAGTVGSPHRLDYTAIGDVINTAARIESETKRQGCEILIGLETYRELPAAARPHVGCSGDDLAVVVAGRDQPVHLRRIDVDTADIDMLAGKKRRG